MASSGSITGAYRGYTLQADWSAVQNAAGNYSDVTVRHTLAIGSAYPLNIASRTNTCSVGGVSQGYTSGAIDRKGGSVPLGTTVHRVPHDADGTKTAQLTDTFDIDAAIDGKKVGSITASGPITLDRIAGNATIVPANDFTDETNPTPTYSRADRKMNVVNAAPELGAVSYEDTNAATVAVTGDKSRIIRNHSTLSVKVPAATAKKGATIASYAIAFGGVTKTVKAAGAVSLGAVDVSHSQALTVTATDSRGFTASQSVQVTVDGYSAPTAVIDLHRLNDSEPTTYITAHARYPHLNGKNGVTITAKFKKVSDSSYGTPIELEDSIQSAVTCDRDSAYDFVVTVADKLESTSYNLTLGKGIPAFFIDTKKSSVGVNCLPSQSDVLQLGGSAWLTAQGAYPVGAIYLSVTNVNPASLFGGTWERIGGRFLLGADSTYAAGSTGGESAHTLTVDEMPRHNHEIGNLNSSGNATQFMTVQAQEKKGYGGNVQTMYAGGGKAHNNLPPYLAVYMWRRLS